jgi:hypothetical protein
MSTSRNEPCPCGSGKKYKHCHLNTDSSNEIQWRLGPLAVAIAAVVAGIVLLFTHDMTIGGPVIAAGVILPIGWAVFTDPPPVKGNADDAAAMKFGK